MNRREWTIRLRTGPAPAVLTASVALALGALASGALAGCAGGDRSDEAVPGTPDTTVAPTPSTAQKTTEDIGIPECPDLVTDAQVLELTGDQRYAAIPDVTNLEAHALKDLFGPAGADAYRQADRTRHCAWGIPNSGTVDQVFVVVLDDAARTALEAEFDEEFEGTSQLGTMRVYEEYSESGASPLSRSFWFDGKVWVSHFSTSEVAPFGSFALNATLAADPALRAK